MKDYCDEHSGKILGYRDNLPDDNASKRYPRKAMRQREKLMVDRMASEKDEEVNNA